MEQSTRQPIALLTGQTTTRHCRNRGDVTIWFSEDAIGAWTAAEMGKRGGQPIYSDTAIETALTLKCVFHLPLRQSEGFLGSILKLMGLDLPCRIDH